jgi:hypothetical protein
MDPTVVYTARPFPLNGEALRRFVVQMVQGKDYRDGTSARPDGDHSEP